MSRKLTQKEFDDIATLSRCCIDAYKLWDATKEIRRLKFLANTLDVDPYIKGLLSELASYSQEAAKQKPHDVKDRWVIAALQSLDKIKSFGLEQEGNENV